MLDFYSFFVQIKLQVYKSDFTNELNVLRLKKGAMHFDVYII